MVGIWVLERWSITKVFTNTSGGSTARSNLSARLQDHLGSFKVELVRARTVNAMNDRILTAG